MKKNMKMKVEVKRNWRPVDGNLNINELLKYKDILPCDIDDKPEVDGEYLMYWGEDGCCGTCGVGYRCKKDGSIIAVAWSGDDVVKIRRIEEQNVKN